MEQKRSSRQGITTRRHFVKLLAGGVAIVGLSACSQPAAPQPAAEPTKPAAAAPTKPAAAAPTTAPASAAPTTAPAAKAEKKLIKIGLIHPFTGNWATGALGMKKAAEMRAEEINQSDKEFEIRIIAEDDGVKPEQGIAAANKLVQQDKVNAVLGALNSNVTLPLVPVLAKLEVPQITVSAAPKITELGSQYVFRMGPTDSKVQKQLANLIVKKMNHQKVAVIYTNDEFGRAGAEAQRAALKEIAVEPAAFEGFNLGEEDVTGQLTRIKTSGATALSLNPGAPDAARVAIQAKRLGLQLQMFGAAQLATPNFSDLAKDAAEGVITVTVFYDGLDDSEVQRIVKEFTEKAKLPMDSWPATDYDGVESVYQAVKKGGSADPKAIAKWLHEHGDQGPLMKGLKWDKDGDGIFNLHVLQYKGGKMTMLQKGGAVS